MRGRILAGAIATLLLPSTAVAADVRVPEDYPTIAAAAVAANAGDTIKVGPGAYNEGDLTIAKSLTIEATTLGATTVTGQLTLTAADTTLRGLIVKGTTPVTVTGDNATLEQVSLLGSTEGARILGTGAKLRRSLVYGDGAAAHALAVRNATAVAHAVTVDSTVLSPGANGTGIVATTAPMGLMDGGPLEVRLVQTTVTGSATAVTRTREMVLLTQGGEITVPAARSIVLGTGDLDAPDKVERAAAPAALFRSPAGRDFRLRADAPVIDKGGAAGAGEADKDFEGDARVSGAASDLGADEFVNRAPTATVKVSDAAPRQGTAVTFDATGSADPEAAVGGGVLRYEWNFGDGTTATTDSPTTAHAFATAAAYRTTVTVVDRQGATASAGVDLGVQAPPADGQQGEKTPPTLRVASPLLNSSLRGTRTITVKKGKKRIKRKQPVQLRFSGIAQDPSGIAKVEVALQYLRGATATTCRFLAVNTMQVKGRACAQPLLYRASFDGAVWSFRTKTKRAMAAGAWQLVAKATDKAGNERVVTLRFTVR